jgi:hypothetical protein
MSDTKLYPAGQKACDHCGAPITKAVETWKGHVGTYCDSEACREAEKIRPKGRYVQANEVRCMSEKCHNFIPEGSYGQ